jgi:hypothetical protein
VKTKLFAIIAVLVLCTTAFAHGDGGFGGSGDFGLTGLGGLGLGGGFGGHHGGFEGLGGDLSINLANNADLLQTHFQTRFDNLKTKYDDGVTNTTDFFTTTTYDNIVDKTQSLSDRYDFFVSGVENTIDRLGDLISNANDDVTFYANLLTNYQSDTSISASKLGRIELVIDRITDRLNSKITTLTTEQTTLQTNLPTYQTFQTDLDTFLLDIQTAGGSTGTTTSGLKALLTSRTLSASSSGSMCDSSSTPLTSTTVPEPSFVGMLLMAIAGIPLVRHRGRRD